MTCTHAGMEYSEGALICSNGRELRCSGDEWQETGYDCQMDTNGNSYQRISDDKLIISDSSVPPEENKKNSTRLACCMPIFGAPNGYARIANTCDSCKTVILDHTNGNITHENIPGNSEIDVKKQSSTIRLLNERNC